MRSNSQLFLTNMTTLLTQRAMELEGVAFCFANSNQFESKVYGDLWNYMETDTEENRLNEVLKALQPLTLFCILLA